MEKPILTTTHVLCSIKRQAVCSLPWKSPEPLAICLSCCSVTIRCDAVRATCCWHHSEAARSETRSPLLRRFASLSLAKPSSSRSTCLPGITVGCLSRCLVNGLKATWRQQSRSAAQMLGPGLSPTHQDSVLAAARSILLSNWLLQTATPSWDWPPSASVWIAGHNVLMYVCTLNGLACFS